MNPELLKFLSAFPSLSEEEVQTIAENIPVESFAKGSALLREGEVSTQCFFVL